MSRSLNKCMLIGNVGQSPEVRSTQSGSRVARLSLATNRSWTDAAGSKKEETQWHTCQFWGRLCDVVEQYVKKGDRLYVEGRIEYRSVEKDGEKRYYTDVVVSELVMLGATGGKGEAHESAPTANESGSDADEDLPF